MTLGGDKRSVLGKGEACVEGGVRAPLPAPGAEVQGPGP